ncbi:MAG: hypothetical protein A2V67_05535 [Deltaproteobacteria bacterium RBG_13_61_14]|nr:MAG: hypothetical protein A2V67_05535 [Deltaproteobacteria bacterium RBG_13_61_14]
MISQRQAIFRILSISALLLIQVFMGCGEADDSEDTGPRARFQKNVRVFSEEKFSQVRLDYENDAAYFPLHYQAALSDLEPGQIIAITTYPGFIGMVTNYETLGGEIRVDVIEVPLTMVFEELYFDMHTEPGETVVFDTSQFPESEDLAISSAGKIPIIYLGGGISLLNPQLDLAVESVNVGVDICPPMVCTGSPFPKCKTKCSGTWWKPWTWKCKTKCSPPTLSCDFQEPYLRSFKFITDSRVNFDFDLDAHYELTGAYTREMNLGPKVAYPVGVVMGMNVEVVPQMMVGCRVFGKAGQTLQYTYFSHNDVRSGMKYNGSWEGVFSKDTETHADSAFDDTNAMGAECYLRPTLWLRFANLAGPFLDIGPYGAFEIHDVDDPPPRAEIKSGFKARLGGKVELLGVNWLNLSAAMTLYDYGYVIWQSRPECPAGESRCWSDWRYQVCGEYDQDPYPEWSLPINCPPGGVCRLSSGETEPGYECSICGDGVKDEGEDCDSDSIACQIGCYAGTQACRLDCSGYRIFCNIGSQACGNGVVEACEVCDSDPAIPCTDPLTTYQGVASCQADCTISPVCLPTEFCGDGTVNGPEECDDGNAGDGDGCSSSCLIERCGDGIVDPGETCDDFPHSPALFGRYLPLDEGHRALAVSGDRAYDGTLDYNTGSDLVHILDLTEPYTGDSDGDLIPDPSAVGQIAGGSRDLALLGDRLYSLGLDGLCERDLSGAPPTLVGCDPRVTDGILAADLNPQQGPRAYVLGYDFGHPSNSAGLLVFNIGSPTNPPSLAGAYYGDYYQQPKGLAVSFAGPPRAYALWGYSSGAPVGFQIFDIASDTPALLYQDSTISGNNLQVSGNYAFIATDTGLKVLDLSAIPPVLVTTYLTWSPVYGIALQDPRAYLSSLNSRITVLDIGALVQDLPPRVVGWYDLPADYCEDLAAVGPRLYGSCRDQGFVVWNIDESGRCNDTCDGFNP